MNESDFVEREDFVYPTLIGHATVISAFIMLLFCLVGFFGNVMSIVVFSHESMRAPINVLLTALSMVDFTLLLFAVPVFILPSLDALYQSEFLRVTYEFASLYLYPISMMAHTCSIWTFVLISGERYIAVCDPLRRHKLLTYGKAKLTELVVVVCSVIYNFVRFWEYERGPITQKIDPFLRVNQVYFLFYYVLLYMATHFLAPFGAILILNMFVLRSLRALDKDRIRRVSRSERQQRKTNQMIIVITIMFAAFTIPPMAINTTEALTDHLFFGPYAAIAFIAMDISNILVVVNSSSTFIIYLVYCRKYRQLFARYASFWKTERATTEEKCGRKSTGDSMTEDYNVILLHETRATTKTSYV